MKSSYRSGYTIIEMGIVLLVIGLLIGTVAIAHGMIRSAEIRSVVSEVAQYTQAVHNFREKYHALPGDFSTATSIWGAAHATPATCINYEGSSNPLATCDGNGDGRIGYYATGASTQTYEWFQAWKQLSNAGLIDGAYQGTSMSDTTYQTSIGTNVPASKASGSGYTIFYAHFPTITASFWPMYGHMLQFGASATDTDSGITTWGPSITPVEAQEIDHKIDDGLPAFGKVMAARSNLLPGCTTSDTAEGSDYSTGDTNRVCALYFMLDL